MTRPKITVSEPDLRQFDGLFTYAEDGFTFLGGYVLGHIKFTDEEERQFFRTCRELESSTNLKVFSCKLKTNNLGLRWMSICSSARSAAYRSYSDPLYGRVYRDYFFMAYFIGIKSLIDLGAKRIAITNLCANPEYRRDEVYCAVDAILKQPEVEEDTSISVLDPGQHDLVGWTETAISELSAAHEVLRPVNAKRSLLPNGDLFFDIPIAMPEGHRSRS